LTDGTGGVFDNTPGFVENGGGADGDFILGTRFTARSGWRIHHALRADRGFTAAATQASNRLGMLPAVVRTLFAFDRHCHGRDYKLFSTPATKLMAFQIFRIAAFAQHRKTLSQKQFSALFYITAMRGVLRLIRRLLSMNSRRAATKTWANSGI
jgi:hypothetical protein